MGGWNAERRRLWVGRSLTRPLHLPCLKPVSMFHVSVCQLACRLRLRLLPVQIVLVARIVGLGLFQKTIMWMQTCSVTTLLSTNMHLSASGSFCICINIEHLCDQSFPLRHMTWFPGLQSRTTGAASTTAAKLRENACLDSNQSVSCYCCACYQSISICRRHVKMPPQCSQLKAYPAVSCGRDQQLTVPIQNMVSKQKPNLAVSYAKQPFQPSI